MAGKKKATTFFVGCVLHLHSASLVHVPVKCQEKKKKGVAGSSVSAL